MFFCCLKYVLTYGHIQLVLLLLLFPTRLDSRSISMDYVRTVAAEFSSRISKQLKALTAYDKIQTQFEKLYSDRALTLSTVDGEPIINNFAASLGKLLDQKANALKSLKSTSETVAAKYDYNPDIAAFPYYNIRKTSDNPNATLVIVPSFSDVVPVNLNKSFVQVPTNIYYQDKLILNVAKWTEDLNPVFIHNYHNSSRTMLYQYFGSNSGLLRVYPGNKNGVDEEKADLYDCRRRLWYIQASTSPKDMVITIDLSGSMIGNNIGIAKIAVMSLIDTLQENDFFNVITINKDPAYVIPCLKTLVQATKQNKEAFKEAVQRLPSPENVLNMDKGMERAFEIMYADSSNTSSANCNRAIMFISDSVEGDYAAESVFEKWNQNKSVRVFTYLVGRVKNPNMKAMKAMSCHNRGYFYRIETLGNVWDTVLEYLEVLSRPLALSNYNQPTYTSVYLDSSGLGMIMTVSLGVFGSDDQMDNTNLLGVTGTDIVLRTLDDTLAKSDIGLFGHGFLANNNGFILSHPKLRHQLGYLPSPPNVFLEDLEHSVIANQSTALRNAMIERKIGKMTFSLYWIYVNDKRLLKTNMAFYYKPVEGTPFTSAISINHDELFKAKATEASFKSMLEMGVEALTVLQVNYTVNDTITNYTFAYVNPWMYCDIKAHAQDSQPISMKVYPTAVELAAYLAEQKKLTENCQAELTSHLVVSAATIYEQVKDVWNEAVVNGSVCESVFCGTSSGYSRYFMLSNKTNPDRDVFKQEFYEHAGGLYRTKGLKVVFSVPLRSHTAVYTGEPTLITSSAPIKIVDGEKHHLEAVMGARLLSSYVDNEFKSSMECKSTDGCVERNCAQNETYGCYMLDEQGYIITSNQGPKYTGRHIGYYHSRFMEHASNVNVSIYMKINLNDTQAECPVLDEYSSSASVLLTPFTILLRLIKYSFNVLLLLATQVQFYTLYLFQNLAHGKMTVDKYINVSCTKSLTFYMLNRDFSSSEESGFVECTPTCTQHYSISLVPETNLLFLMLELRPCNGHCSNLPFHMEAVKLPSETVCHQKKELRKPPNVCFSFNKTESTQCGAGHMNKPLTTLLTAIILLSLAMSLM